MCGNRKPKFCIHVVSWARVITGQRVSSFPDKTGNGVCLWWKKGAIKFYGGALNFRARLSSSENLWIPSQSKENVISGIKQMQMFYLNV